MNSYKERPGPYERLARERVDAAAKAEAERLARIRFVAAIGPERVVGSTLDEVGRVLLDRGYQMHKARMDGDALMVPHAKKKPVFITRTVK